MTARFLVGDVFDMLATLEPNSVDLVLTSPPFLALRSYLPADHDDKHRELGSEATPGEYIDRLLDVVEACDRVLAPHGSLVFELGDTYAGSGGAGGDYDAGGLRNGQAKFGGSKYRRRPGRNTWEAAHPIAMPPPHTVATTGSAWPLDKSLTLIPETFRWALVYGRNPHTGRTTPPWRVRNVVRWVRPNPPVGALGDKFRPGTTELVVACHNRDRYFDLDAVRTPAVTGDRVLRLSPSEDGSGRQGNAARKRGEPEPNNPAGAPPLDWWEIPTHPYPGAHYATWPPMLCAQPIKAMCPERVCRTCGQPSRRIVDSQVLDRNGKQRPAGSGWNEPERRRAEQGHTSLAIETVGWSDCGHHPELWAGDWQQVFALTGAIAKELRRYEKMRQGPEKDRLIEGAAARLRDAWQQLRDMYRGKLDGFHDGDNWRPGMVLDPFAGSGTTLAVATGHGCDAIGIDLDERNAWLARDRVGMLLDIELPSRIVDVPTGGAL